MAVSSHRRLLSQPPPTLPPSSSPSLHRSLSSPCQTPPRLPFLDLLAGGLHSLVAQASFFLSSGALPTPIPGGSPLGAFQLSSFAILKPSSSSSSSSSCSYAALREVAAFLLDHRDFSGVPPTALVLFSPSNSPPWATASLQRYVPHSCDAADLGPSTFTVRSVHRIAILDVRLLNLDRHAGNILVQRGGELVPIDHGLCLPQRLEDPYFEWLHWPQSSVGLSQEEMEYVQRLDPFEDLEVLRRELPMLAEQSGRVLVVCTIFLKRAVAAGLTLADVGAMMTRDLSGQSELERVCRQAAAAVAVELHCEAEISGGSGGGGEEGGVVGCLVQRKPPKVPMKKGRKEEESGKGKVVGGRTKSVSSSCVLKVSQDGCISFKRMNEEEWQLFLEAFGELLPAAFERRRRNKQGRIVTSCSF
ncbi:phosphatidylinositol 4-kinase gamma 8-like [Wolffia australiana]